MKTVYEAAGGDDGILRLARAWHARVMADEVVSHAFRHGVHEEMDRRAIACFDQALTDVALSGDDPVRAVLHDYFAWATTSTMARYHPSADDVPAGLRTPRWSWDGLEG
jgi:hemoglobin